MLRLHLEENNKGVGKIKHPPRGGIRGYPGRGMVKVMSGNTVKTVFSG